jgi:hypothetical protein
MKFKITVNDEVKEIEIKMRMKHAKRIYNKYFEAISEMKKLEGDDLKNLDVDNLKNVIEESQKIAQELTGLKDAEIDEIDVEEYEPIVKYIREKADSFISFMKP